MEMLKDACCCRSIRLRNKVGVRMKRVIFVLGAFFPPFYRSHSSGGLDPYHPTAHSHSLIISNPEHTHSEVSLRVEGVG